MTTLLTAAPDPGTTPSQQAEAQAAATAAAAPPAAASPPRSSAGRLVLTGALSRADAADLEPRLEDLVRTGGRTVEVDLSRAQAMDTAVARLLLRTSWRLGAPDRRLVLLHPAPQVRRVLDFVGARHLVVR